MTKEDFKDFLKIREDVRRARKMLIIKRLLLILLIIIVMLFLIGSRYGGRYTYTEDTYVVQKGDTLWRIAEIYCPEYMDKRDYIEEVKQDNGCGTLIRTGDVLTVRVYDAK